MRKEGASVATVRDAMKADETRRVELILPMRTVLLVAATLGVLGAFVAIVGGGWR
jgi:hypothetical protein